MNFQRLSQRLMASSLALVLVACGATSPTVRSPSDPLELRRFVLVIQETQDGQRTHEWKPLSDFDLKQYAPAWGVVGGARTVELTGRRMSDEHIGDACEEVWERCMRRCMSSPLPPHAEHYLSSRKSARAALEAYCSEECRGESDDCRRKLKRQAAESLEFGAIDDAVDWLKRHKEEIAVGAAVIITGVVFYAVLSSGGILILAPALLLAPSNVPAEHHLAEALR
jgi:hypothetical protein